MKNSGIGPYMNLQNMTDITTGGPNKSLICPSDVAAEHLKTRVISGQTVAAYPYSYTVNYRFSCKPMHSSLTSGGYARLSQVTNSSAILVEESGTTNANIGAAGGLDDALCTGWDNGDRFINPLSTRHDPSAVHTVPDVTTDAAPNVRNANAVGDVGFIDGHIEFLARKVAHTRIYNVGVASDFAGTSEPTFQP